MKKVYYIGWYISDMDKETYSGNVPGNLKMHYVVEQLKQSKFVPEIISFASKREGFGYYNSIITQSQGCQLRYLCGFKGTNKLLKLIDIWLKKIQFAFILFFRINKDDTVILYHSYAITRLLARLKRLVKRKVIIEVEEIYGYSAVEDRPWVNEEIKSIKNMDCFIFVNEGIPSELDIPKNKFVVSYGVGYIPERRVERFDDGKIHVVYAGTVEMKKLGALTAVESARFFPDNYVLHILGFGNNESLQKLREQITLINNEVGYERVQYNGYKSGKELDDFLFSCHIGLSSNVMRPNFANNSFPSKVITYMCHDLSVVLGYAKAFFDVPMSNGWVFYHEYSPEKIAEAIMKAEIHPIGFYHPAIERMNSELVDFFDKNC